MAAAGSVTSDGFRRTQRLTACADVVPAGEIEAPVGVIEVPAGAIEAQARAIEVPSGVIEVPPGAIERLLRAAREECRAGCAYLALTTGQSALVTTASPAIVDDGDPQLRVLAGALRETWADDALTPGHVMIYSLPVRRLLVSRGPAEVGLVRLPNDRDGRSLGVLCVTGPDGGVFRSGLNALPALASQIGAELQARRDLRAMAAA